jgi:hypothetical protein
MRINRGKIIVIALIVSNLNANDINYSFHISNKTPYLKEATILEVNLSQLDHSKVMFFNFSPKKSDKYKFKQIDFKEDEKYHNLNQSYKYIIYPLRENNISIEFDMIKSITTDENVAYAISGDRDNIKSLEKEDIKVNIPPLFINVKKLPNNADLVGDFKLKYNIDKTKTKAYKPIYINIEIKGEGYIEPLDLIPKSKNYYLFREKPKISKNKITFDYALSSKKSFKIPKVVIKAFNPKNKKSYNLTIPSTKIEVQKIDINTIIDKEDSPKSINKQENNYQWIGWLFSYIIVFLSGFFMPRDIFKKWIKKGKNSFKKEVLLTKNKKDLLKVLLRENPKKFHKIIKLLEEDIYGSKRVNLKNIKKEILNV